MYVAMVNVNKLERSASFAVCWTTRVNDECGQGNSYNVKLWGSETVARTHRDELIGRGESTHVIRMPVISGTRDQVWIDPGAVNHGTIAELSNGWYYQDCYAKLIGSEARKLCDQVQDDVHAEATTRP